MGFSSDPGGERTDNFRRKYAGMDDFFFGKNEGIYVEEKLNY